tara:strand:+ start:2257 stop:2577 length:321 start_codon:yes stop_codon:yes gene_type:complete
MKNKPYKKPLMSDNTTSIVFGIGGVILLGGLLSAPIIMSAPSWAEHKYNRGTRVTLENGDLGRVLKCIATKDPNMPEYKIRIRNSDGSYTEVQVFEDEITEKKRDN